MSQVNSQEDNHLNLSQINNSTQIKPSQWVGIIDQYKQQQVQNQQNIKDKVKKELQQFQKQSSHIQQKQIHYYPSIQYDHHHQIQQNQNLVIQQYFGQLNLKEQQIQKIKGISTGQQISLKDKIGSIKQVTHKIVESQEESQDNSPISKTIHKIEIQKPLQTPSSQNQKGLFIEIAQNDQIPLVELKLSNQTDIPIKIKFINYNLQYFLKIQTQIFTIQVTNPQNYNKPYQIHRRFSDFVFLFEAITINHLGYILYPFPLKNLQTFMKLKLNLNKNEGQKIQLIQQRMLQLQKFSNYLLQHQQLRNSQQILIFFQQDQKLQKQRKRIQSYIEQYRNLQSYSNLKSLMDMSVNFISGYLNKQKLQKKSYNIRKQDLQFSSYLDKIQNYIYKITTLIKLFQQLSDVQFTFSQFIDIQTDIDTLMKLCAKHSSGKQYCKYITQWINNQMLDFLSFKFRQLKQIQQQLLYRIQLIDISKQLYQKNQQKQRYQKLKRRIIRFQRNFHPGWLEYFPKFQKEYQQYSKQFHKVWSEHKKNMNKIWNKKK